MDWNVIRTTPMANQVQVEVSLPVNKTITVNTEGMSPEEAEQAIAKATAEAIAELTTQTRKFFAPVQAVKVEEPKEEPPIEESEEPKPPVEVHAAEEEHE